MDHFQYQDGQLYCEQTPVDRIINEVGSPAYIYSRATFEHHLNAIAGAFSDLDPLICYSVKSCGNIHLLRMLAEQGAGMDVVSGGELYRAQQADVDPRHIVYAGVGKTDQEIEEALQAGIGWFNIESETEFENIAAIARRLGTTGRAALRINPDVDQTTHKKTTTGKKESKFGVDIERARRFFEAYGHNEHLKLEAIHLHIGSPVYQTEPYTQAVRKAMHLIAQLRDQGYQVNTLDLGGGFGADYESEQSPRYDKYAKAIAPIVKPFKDAGGRIILEPGRTIAANAGVLDCEVQHIKQSGEKQFVIVDTGMHHMIRPTLYDAFQFLWPTWVDAAQTPSSRTPDLDLPGLVNCDVVGPICESGDWLALNRALPPMQRGGRLAVFGAGAYGMTMSSQYNAMCRPPEILVEGDTYRTIRRRETYRDLLAGELEPALNTPDAPAAAPTP
jgi:diaminopimelate decarboxylase